MVFLLMGGVLADWLPRFRLMACSNLIACGAQTGIAAMFVGHAAPLGAVATLSFVNGAAAALFLPASQGVIPQIVPADQLQLANALMRLSRNATSIAGSAVAGVLVATIGAGWALACDAATFAVAAALITGIRAGQVSRAATATVLADLREGWQEFRSRSWVWLLVVQFSFVNGCWAAVSVLGPLLARQSLGGAPAWAATQTAMAVGLVSGSLAAIRLRPALADRGVLAGQWGLRGHLRGAVEHLAAGHIPNETLARISSYDMLGSFVLGPLGLLAVGPSPPPGGSPRP